jgi:nitrogen fixation protein NifQ
MKWKKFFARALCLDGAFPICTAPSCGECDELDACFGDESGESLLAHLRR